jgi:hypothetical protein
MASLFEGTRIGEPQAHGSVILFPLLAEADWGPKYLSLGEALVQGTFRVSEVSDSGSVPELKVCNDGEFPVLLLDGEELAGAKQNRVLNTTVLVPGKTSVVIPVSCTEHGRWHSVSAHFRESSHHMARTIRCEKNRSVSDSLRKERSFRSDQGRVCENIEHLACAAEAHSPTGAMSDVFRHRERDLDAYIEAFPLMPHQRGLLVFLKGLPAGLDLVSREGAYGRLHEKLVKSYCIEDALRPSRRKSAPGLADAEAFLKRASSCPGIPFPSPGMGSDLRFESDGLVGSALVVDGAAVHAAFFVSEERHGRHPGEEPFAPLRQRRANRRRPGPGPDDGPAISSREG